MLTMDKPLLLMHGGEDGICPPSQNKVVYPCLAEKGVPTGLVVYPSETWLQKRFKPTGLTKTDAHSNSTGSSSTCRPPKNALASRRLPCLVRWAATGRAADSKLEL